ncbi:MAG: hypothetical protein KDD42_03950, partial [Bdellovibrionales bacterium]|nr:hypothetical protein [Bdellovibrionales bacterium]
MTIEYGAVLFDFDGVMADTTAENFAAWQWAISEWNVQIAPEEYFPFEGYKIKFIAENFLRNHA